MKYFKKEFTPATTKMILDRTACDLCKSDMTSHHGDDFENVDVVTLEHRTGTSYPEGGSGEMVVVDMCSMCFKEKLSPWLKSQGAELFQAEWEH